MSGVENGEVNSQKFSEVMWEKAESLGLVEKIVSHGFIRGLVDGSLSEACFREYIIQDWKYLEVYGRALALLASKAQDAGHAAFFARAAQSILQGEVQLHKKLMSDWGVTVHDAETAPMMPACLMYTSYLLAVVATKPYHEGLAAVLPCYWIYGHVGQSLRAQGSRDAKYQAWIDMYGGEEFDGLVQQAISIVDSVAERLHEDQKACCLEHFVMNAKLEYMFFDGPLRQERWPC